jgi:hypothetical protein
MSDDEEFGKIGALAGLAAIVYVVFAGGGFGELKKAIERAGKETCMVPVGDSNYKNTHPVAAGELGEIKSTIHPGGVVSYYWVNVLGTQFAKAEDVERCGVALPSETREARIKLGRPSTLNKN